MSVYIYVCIHIYMYIYMCVCVCVCRHSLRQARSMGSVSPR